MKPRKRLPPKVRLFWIYHASLADGWKAPPTMIRRIRGMSRAARDRGDRVQAGRTRKFRDSRHQDEGRRRNCGSIACSVNRFVNRTRRDSSRRSRRCEMGLSRSPSPSCRAQPTVAFRALEEQLVAHPLDVDFTQTRSPAPSLLPLPATRSQRLVRGRGGRGGQGQRPVVRTVQVLVLSAERVAVQLVGTEEVGARCTASATRSPVPGLFSRTGRITRRG